MKKFIFTLAFAALGSVASLNAQTNENNTPVETQVNINHRSRDFVEVTLKKDSSDVVRVNIYGRTGVLLHRDVVRKENLVRFTYDLSQFPTGVYAIEIEENKRVIQKKELDLGLFEYYQVAKQ